MVLKKSVKENVVGWYSSGPRIRPADMAVHELIKKYCPNPKEDFEIPAKSYVSVETIPEDEAKQPTMVFHHIASEIGAFEAEEVGIEHLLRDVKDTTVSTLATQVNKKINSLKSLVSNIDEIQTYLSNVVSGKLPINQQILGQLQDLFKSEYERGISQQAFHIENKRFYAFYLHRINDSIYFGATFLVKK